MPEATIIMRTKNSDWVVREALEALYSQDYRDFELLVVDSGSTDDTLEILADYPHRLIEISAESYYPGPVLNMAFENCSTRSSWHVAQTSGVGSWTSATSSADVCSSPWQVAQETSF